MRLPGILTRNLGLKLLATGLALVVWATVVYAGNPPESRTVSVAVPQDPASLPGNFVLAHAVPDITVRVSGTRDHVNAFNPSSLSMRVDWGHVNHAGQQWVPATIVNSDSNVDLDNAPTAVLADIDRKWSKKLDVHIVINPGPPAGYVTDPPVVTPAQVTVGGPQRELSGLTAEVVLNFSNRRTNYTADGLKVVVMDQYRRTVGDILVDPPTVGVSITVRAVTTTKVVAAVPRVSGAVASGRELSGVVVSPPTVTLTGPEDLLNGIDSVFTTAISISGLGATHTFNVPVVTPAGVTASPAQVYVTFDVAPIPAPPTPTPAPPRPSATPTPTPSPAPSPTP